MMPFVHSTFALVFFSGILLKCGLANDCAQREYDTGIVCVCNSTFCDTLPGVDPISNGTYQLFTTNEAGLRFEVSTGSFSDDIPGINLAYITIDQSVEYQTVLGYGGAFTDSTGINIASLSEQTQEYLLRSYFSEDGSEYTFGRIPIAGSDFSVRNYTYDDEGDGSLDTFSLQEEDYNYKIPYILRAYNLSNGNLNLIASAWSSPIWTKTSNNITYGFLEEEYYQYWADYHDRFFEAYSDNGIEIWGVTTQNEPGTGVASTLSRKGINSIAWFPSQLTTYLTQNLGPTIRNSSFSDIKIIIHDDQSPNLFLAQEYYNNAEALYYLDGTASHWYGDKLAPDSAFLLAQTDKKDIFLLMTEACSGYLAAANLEEPVVLGSWERGTDYIQDVLRLTNLNYNGWIDWNLVLDLEGGPNWVGNNVDAPIIVNATADEFYKQPMYYALAQVSKFVPPGSIRIEASGSLAASLAGITTSAFLRPDGSVAVVIYNEGDSQDIVISDSAVGETKLTLTANSINTLVYV